MKTILKRTLPKTYPVTCHTKHVGEGSMFVAIKGYKVDGAIFIKDAIACGAKTIVLEQSQIEQSQIEQSQIEQSQYTKELDQYIKDGITFEIVKDARTALAERASFYLKHPAQKLKIIGITGTKGKTTTAFLVEHILKTCGKKTAMLGTIKNKIGDYEFETNLTTPSSDDLHMFFAECVKQGVEYVVMEVSSHAIATKRVYGIDFEVVGFTNLAPEHMDFHENMEDYFTTKAKLFSQVKPGGAIVINSDDEWGREAITRFALRPFDKLKAQGEREEVGAHPEPSKRPTMLTLRRAPQDGRFSFLADCPERSTAGAKSNGEGFKSGPITDTIDGICVNNLCCKNLCGEFNAYNILMAAKICEHLKVDQNKIKHALKTFPGVPGRLQKHILKNHAIAFVDFAHNPSSFNAVLKVLRGMTDHLIVVFGCGGDRDKTKRSVMGKLASLYGDEVLVTDDNPRSEDSYTIIKEICVGISEKELPYVICEPDRKKAIAIAVKKSRIGSVIAILGKGHETHYLINDQVLHFDDFQEISQY